MSINTVKEITTLLSEQTTLEEKTLATNNIINDYNLDLTVDEILQVFSKTRQNIQNLQYVNNYKRHEYLFNFLLKKNIGMFVALIKFYNYEESKHIYFPMIKYVSQAIPFKFGLDHDHLLDFIIDSYKTLLDFNDFDTNNLGIPKSCLKKIQKYRDKIYNGKLTKAVN